MKKSVKIGAISAICAIASAMAFLYPSAASADAEAPDSIELAPLSVESDVTYRYFSAPTSVYADAAGIYVADGESTVTVAPDMSFSSRDIPSEKIYRYNDYFISLDGGVITSYYGDSQTVFTGAVDYTDFDVYSGKLYAIGGDKLTVIPLGETSLNDGEATTVTLSYDGSESARATAVAVAENSVYATVYSNAFFSKQTIVSVNDDGSLSPVLTVTDPVLALTVMDNSGVVYALTRDRITGYMPVGGGLVERFSVRDARMTSVYAYDGFLYGIDTLNALYKISQNLEDFEVIAASADDSDGFFNMPYGAAAKNSTLYVADSQNGRIARFGDGLSYIESDLLNPVSVACDSSGGIYIAHSYNRITVTGNADHKDLTVDGVIRQIAINADKQLFILAENGLYMSENSGTPVKISDTAYKAITLSVGHEDLYALLDGGVVKLTVTDGIATETDYCSADGSHFSLAVDLAGNVYLLSRTAVTRVGIGGNVVTKALTQDGSPYTLGFSCGQITLASIGNGYVKYGDAVIVDTYKHRVFTADGSADGLNVKLIDEDYDVPDIKNDTTASSRTGGLIRVALYDAPVFSLPMETPAVYTIAEGRKVIVPMYDLEDTREYSLILIDNLTTGELIQGYVYKDALSDPLPYVTPPSDIGTVYTNATPVYKWPSPNSVSVRNYSAVDRNTEFKILDFVESYRDDYNNLWYRILVDNNCEGYILAVNLSMMKYEPVFIRPSYDAEIISYNGSKYAMCYELSDGKYVPIDITLDTGTEVEIVGTFDTSEHYTQIKYLDPSLGTLTCYVETVYLEYNGVNVVLLVAIVVIVITVILAAIIIARVVYLKKKRLSAPPNDEESDVL